MDRKGIIGIILSIGLFVWFQVYIQKTKNAHEVAVAAAAIAEANAPKSTSVVPVADSPAPAGAPDATVAAIKPVVEQSTAKIDLLSTPTVEYSFTNLGGGISKVRLPGHKAEAESQVIINEFGKLPIGSISEIAGEGATEPFSAKVDAAAGEIVFERTNALQLHTSKKFVLPHLAGADSETLLREEYRIRMDVTFTNRGQQSLQVPAYFVSTGSSAPIHERDQSVYTCFNHYRDGNKSIDANWFGAGMPVVGHADRAVFTEASGGILWAGVTNQYFASLVSPVADLKLSSDVLAKHRGSQVWARRFVVDDPAWMSAGHLSEGKGRADRFGIDGALGMPGFTLKPGESMAQSFYVYTGPREFRRLKLLGSNEDDVMNFGMFAIVSKTLLNSMNLLKGWLGNYAWAVVVLTLLIKTLLYPLQNKATSSMKRMQSLQPKMTELKEKYKDDPTRVNVEVMKLYKDYGVNPMAGCIPMVVQIPIFFGFYSMLGVAVELRDSKFLWVKDLSQPDTVAHLLGYPINILPLCMAVTMLVQMAIQPKQGDPAQQRIFMFMPLIFIFFCYNFASALALYWTVQNLFSIVQLYATRSQTLPTLEKIAASPKKA